MRNIVLLGFMGTGKSAVGKRLATHLGFQFIDTDQLIEARTQKKITEIFSQEGEASFRALESQVATEVAERSDCVISTGGGIVLNPVNLDRLSRHGILVLLEARPEVILKRVQKRAAQRPLLKGSDLLSEIKRLLLEREPYYRRAAFVVDTSELKIDDVVGRIKDKVLEIEGRKNTA